MTTAAFIFDFDGTLVDSEQAIYQCFQSITKQLAPERLEYSKNILIGPPLRDTASEILGPEHHDSLDEFVRLFIAMHDEQVIEHTQIYPNVIEVLKLLNTKGIPMAIATNKRKSPTQKLIEHFSLSNYFQLVKCNDSDESFKTKRQMIEEIVRNKIFVNKKIYFIGDTVNDGLSANLNHIDFIRANYGYGHKQDWSKVKIIAEIDNFSQITQILS